MGRRKSQRNESDMRRHYRELMAADRFRFPRDTALKNHTVSWYLDGHLDARPVNALYAYACFAEYLLHRVRFGRCGQKGAERTVDEFFAETRRAMQNALSTYPIGRKLNPAERASLCRVAARLGEHARAAHAEVGRVVHACKCPACNGKGTMRGVDADLLEAILCEQSRLGNIPPTSYLFREKAVDKIPQTVV